LLADRVSQPRSRDERMGLGVPHAATTRAVDHGAAGITRGVTRLKPLCGYGRRVTIRTPAISLSVTAISVDCPIGPGPPILAAPRTRAPPPPSGPASRGRNDPAGRAARRPADESSAAWPAHDDRHGRRRAIRSRDDVLDCEPPIVSAAPVANGSHEHAVPRIA